MMFLKPFLQKAGLKYCPAVKGGTSANFCVFFTNRDRTKGRNQSGKKPSGFTFKGEFNNVFIHEEIEEKRLYCLKRSGASQILEDDGYFFSFLHVRIKGQDGPGEAKVSLSVYPMLQNTN